MFKDTLQQLENDYDYSIEHGIAKRDKLSFTDWAWDVHGIDVSDDDTPFMYIIGVTSAEVPF
jgi:hypothetical protein